MINRYKFILIFENNINYDLSIFLTLESSSKFLKTAINSQNSKTTDIRFQQPITAAVISQLAKSKMIPAKVVDNTKEVRSIVRNTAFILANLLSLFPAITTIQSLSTTIFCPMEAKLAKIPSDITTVGTIHF